MVASYKATEYWAGIYKVSGVVKAVSVLRELHPHASISVITLYNAQVLCDI